MEIFRQLSVVYCAVGLARCGIGSAGFRFQRNRKLFQLAYLLEHSLENCKTVECISQFPTLLRVCDRQSA